MKDYLHLFTPVSEGLPEPGTWVTVINEDGNPYINKIPFHSSITHWLDLSKLTTKEEAHIKYEHGYGLGHSEGYNAGFNDGNKNANMKD